MSFLKAAISNINKIKDEFINELPNRVSKASHFNKKFQAIPEERAGREAEYLARKQIMNKIKNTGWIVHNTVRVPDWKKHHRREIDFVITSPSEAFIIELKNWSGQIYLRDNSVIQKRRYKDEELDHGPIFDDFEDKVNTLKSFHQSKSRYDVKMNHYIVFYNRKLSMPTEISSRKDVIKYSNLMSLLPKQSSGVINFLEALLQFFGIDNSTPTTTEPSKGIRDLRDTLSEVGSWDVIELNGDKIIFGDILFKGKYEKKSQLAHLFNRKEVESIDAIIDRSIVKAIFTSPEIAARINHRDGSEKRETVQSDFSISYQSAGCPSSDEVNFCHVKRIEYGYISRPVYISNWDNFRINKRYLGIIKNIESFGYFIDIGAPFDGLLREKYIKKCGYNLEDHKVGDQVEVCIVSFDLEQKKIGFDFAEKT